MDFKDMTIEELEARQAAIVEELDTAEDLDALEEEARSIKEELETRKNNEAKKAAIRSSVAMGEGVKVRDFVQEVEKEMSPEEVRNSKEYIDAFARYIKTNDDSECRAILLSKNAAANGQVPVPTYIEGRVRTAWERNGLMELVRKTYIRGNVQVGFELSATGAVVHAEGADAPTEETLTFGIVSMVPQSIKKWIRISDEAIDLGGEEFLDYVYDEITYQIAKAASNQLIALIKAAPAASTATAAAVASISGAPGLAIVAQAIANLSDDASNPAIVMNKLTYADFIAAQTQASYAADPFFGLPVIFNNSLDAYSAAEGGEEWLIVGDFGYGAQANFPNGDEITIKYDDLSEAQSDLVKLVGREYVALGVVAPNAFVKVTKAEG